MGVERKGIPDFEVRRRALDPTESFIVQAPAGSGKTELLMQRFLRLLATVDDPGEVLAITFTRKAAGEMANRILDALRDARAGKPVDEPHRARARELAGAVLARDRELDWGILENPSTLRIMTMDSFSASLVRKMPILSRGSAAMAVTEEPGELYAEAARRTLDAAEEETPVGDAVRTVLRHLDNNPRQLTDRLTEMLRKRDQWLRHLARGLAGSGGGATGPRGVLEGSLANVVEGWLARTAELLPRRLEPDLIESARYAAANLDDGPVKALDDMAALPGPSAEDLPLWRGMAELLLTNNGDPRKPGGVNKRIGFPTGDDEARNRKEAFKEILDGVSRHEDFVEALAQVKELPDPRYTDYDWEVLASFLVLLPEAVSRLEEVFTEDGTADFQSVASAAARALGGSEDPTELMLAIDMRLRHLLVDEYQDTSRTQLELIESLVSGWEPGEGRTLFVVGDPMQSIYLFREAEVGLFLEAKAGGIGGVPLTPLTLSSNFRSQRGIVDWVNSSFAGAFPGREDPGTGSVTYALAEAVREEMERLDPDVHIYRERDDIREAREIAGAARAVPEGESIAVLVRSKSHLAEVVRAFKEEGIEFAAQDIDPLTDRPVVRDLLSLLRLLLHPMDRVAWLSALRAPWCGISLKDLHALCLGDGTGPVASLMVDPEKTGGLSPEGVKRLEKTAGKLERALELRGRTSPGELVEGLWLELGGPACLSSPSDLADARVLLDLVHREGSWDPASALSIENRLSALFAAPSAGEGSVEVMTIHKAKGLEFDHVILPGLGKKPSSGRNELMVWLELGPDLLLAPIEGNAGESSEKLYNFVKGIHREKEKLEDTRVLYVAATRARKSLRLFGHVNEDSSGEISVQGASLLNSLSHRLESHITVEEGAPDGDGSAVSEARPGPLRRLPVEWTPPEPAPAVETAPPEEPSPGAEEPEFLWAGPEIRHLGTVVHARLCEIASEGVGAWDEERINRGIPVMEARLRALGLGSARAAENARKAAGIIARTLGDPTGRWALGDHEEAEVELPMSCMIDGVPVRVIMDRTFVDRGVRWVIDYKASLHEGGDRDRFLESERIRYAPQLERYARVLREGGEDREIKKGLYYPALGAWVEVD